MSTSTGTDVPATAMIPLPPGFTMDQFLAFQSDLVSIAITAALAFGIIVWDYFYLLPDEYKFYQRAKKEEWRTLAPYSFIALRCSGIVSILAVMCISSLQSEHCQAGLAVSQLGAVIVVAMAGISFGYRVTSVWGSNKTIAIIVAVTYSLMVVSWIAVASQYRVITGQATPFGSNCQMEPFVSWSSFNHAASFIFNLMVLILMLMKFGEQRNRQTNVLHLPYRDSLAHIVIATAASFTVVIISFLSADYHLAKQVVLPYSTLITATMGARVFLTLRLSTISSPGTRSKPDTGFEFNVATTGETSFASPGARDTKLAYVIGSASPASTQRSDITETKASYNPYTSFPSPPHKHLASPSPSSAASLPQTSYRPPQGQPLPVDIDDPPPPPAKVAPTIVSQIVQNAYTTFPEPPSPPQLPQPIGRESIDDSSTPLLKAKFSVPIMAKKGKKGKKPQVEDEYQKSAWV